MVTEQRDGELAGCWAVLGLNATRSKSQHYSTGQEAERQVPLIALTKSLLSVPPLCNLEQWLKPAPEGSQGCHKHLPMTGGGRLPLCQPLRQTGMERRQRRKVLGTCGLRKGNNSVCRCWFGGTWGGLSTSTCSGPAARLLPAAGFGRPSL